MLKEGEEEEEEEEEEVEKELEEMELEAHCFRAPELTKPSGERGNTEVTIPVTQQPGERLV